MFLLLIFLMLISTSRGTSSNFQKEEDKEILSFGDFQERDYKGNEFTEMGKNNLCFTVAGPSIGRPCVFPFVHKGKLHFECISDNGYSWCSTEVDQDRRHKMGMGKWGKCGKECPIPPSKRFMTITDYCISNIPNETCDLECEAGEWICHGKCISRSKPCLSLCPKGSWRCWEECISDTEPCLGICDQYKWNCNGTCIDTTLACGIICPRGSYNCDGECILPHEPCRDVCQANYFLNCWKECQSTDELQNDPIENWLCDGKCQQINEPCKGKCPSEEMLLSCNGNCEFNNSKNVQICNGKCLGINFSCDGKCLLEWQHPCHEKCQHWSLPCDGQCPRGSFKDSDRVLETTKCPNEDKCIDSSTFCQVAQNEDSDNQCKNGMHLSRETCENPQKYNITTKCEKINKIHCTGYRSSQCFNSHERCDGFYDCIDRSDESGCLKIDYSIFVDCIDIDENGNTFNGFLCEGDLCLNHDQWCSSSFPNELKKSLKCTNLLKTILNKDLCQNITFWKGRNRSYAGGLDKYSLCLNTSLTNSKELGKEKVINQTGFMYLCKNNETWINQELICDGYVHCPDGSDEDQSQCQLFGTEVGFPSINSSIVRPKHRQMSRAAWDKEECHDIKVEISLKNIQLYSSVTIILSSTIAFLLLSITIVLVKFHSAKENALALMLTSSNEVESSPFTPLSESGVENVTAKSEEGIDSDEFERFPMHTKEDKSSTQKIVEEKPKKIDALAKIIVEVIFLLIDLIIQWSIFGILLKLSFFSTSNNDISTYFLVIFVVLILNVIMSILFKLFVIHTNVSALEDNTYKHLMVLLAVIPSPGSKLIRNWKYKSYRLNKDNKINKVWNNIELGFCSTDNVLTHFTLISCLSLVYLMKTTNTITLVNLEPFLSELNNEIIGFLCAYCFMAILYRKFEEFATSKKGIVTSWVETTLEMFFIFISLAWRIAAIVMYFVPTLGLLDSLMHWKVGGLPEKHNTELFYDYTSELKIPFFEIWKPLPDPTNLTNLTFKAYFSLFWAFVLLHFICITLIKCYYHRGFQEIRKNLDIKIISVLSSISIPSVYPIEADMTKTEQLNEMTEMLQVNKMTKMEQMNEMTKKKQKQSNMMTEMEQPNKMTEMKPLIEVTNSERSNEMTETKQLNEITETEQLNEVTKTEQLNEIIEMEQLNDMTKTEQLNEIIETEQLNEMTKAEKLYEMTKMEHLNEITETEQLNEVTNTEQSNKMTEMEQPNEMKEMERLNEITETEPLNEIIETEQLNEMTKAEQLYEMTKMQQLNENRGTEQLNEVTKTEQSNKMTEMEQLSPVSKTERSNEMTEKKQLNEIIETEQLNEVTKTEQLNDIIKMEYLNEVKNMKQLNEMITIVVLFAVEHFILCIPVFVLFHSIQNRNKYLNEFFLLLAEEEKSTNVVLWLIIVWSVACLVVPLLQLWLYNTRKKSTLKSRNSKENRPKPQTDELEMMEIMVSPPLLSTNLNS